MSSGILSVFNNHFVEFVEDIHRVFPDDVDILTAKNSLLMIRKANPKMIIKCWDVFIVGKYKTVIEGGDISFFIDKDYSNDLQTNRESKKINDAIDRLRAPVKMMNEEEKAKIVKYLQNLTKLSEAYKQ
jgi:accessory colonization factor AcfC